MEHPPQNTSGYPKLSVPNNKVKQLHFIVDMKLGYSYVLATLQGPGKIWWRQPQDDD